VNAVRLGVGAEYGRGALRSSDAVRRYYSAAIGSVGWQVGAQSKAIVPTGHDRRGLLQLAPTAEDLAH
jgi:hypothetical protein